jgi:hypothetical protein
MNRYCFFINLKMKIINNILNRRYTFIILYLFLTISQLLYLNEHLCIVEQEWMSDSLSKGFYNGKPNPFEVRTVVLYRTCS